MYTELDQKLIGELSYKETLDRLGAKVIPIAEIKTLHRVITNGLLYASPESFGLKYEKILQTVAKNAAMLKQLCGNLTIQGFKRDIESPEDLRVFLLFLLDISEAVKNKQPVVSYDYKSVENHLLHRDLLKVFWRIQKYQEVVVQMQMSA